MSLSLRRFFVPVALLAFVALISADRLSAPVAVQAVFDEAGPAWDPLSTYDIGDTPAAVRYPPRLLAGTNSHVLPASAASRNGYCLDVNVDGITPISGFGNSLGFRLVATDPIDPNAPASLNVPVPATGTYVSGVVAGAGTAALNAGSGSTADDVYCVVAYAPPGYKKLTIEWHYQIAGEGDNVIALKDIPIVTVSLVKIGNGLIAAPAEVCTVGWDSAFLTGAASNAGGLLGATPDPVNKVSLSDWSISQTDTPINGTVVIAYVRQFESEWCAGIASDAEEDNLQVTFNFHAVYNRVDIGLRDHDADDQPASVQLPTTSQPPTPNQLVDIRNGIELRHVTIDGYIPPRQRSAPLVIGGTHYVCIAGTDAADTLAANQITFNQIGPPDAASATAVNIFHKSAADEPRLNASIANGTLCFAYTSPSPGEQSISARFTDNPGGTLRDAFFDSDGDGNGITISGEAGPLIAAWNKIDETRITEGGTPNSSEVTFTTINLPLIFNVADGTFIADQKLTEWVLGSHRTGGVLRSGQLLNGVLIRAEIVGGCGYFVVPNGTKPNIIRAVSVGGRLELNNGDENPYSPAFGDIDAIPDDISFSVLNDAGCTPGSQVRLQVDVFYPDKPATPAAEQEWVDFTFTFRVASSTPRLAWAGEFVTVTYAIASGVSCKGQVIHFVRPENQPGTFIPDAGVVLNGPNHAKVDFGDACSATVRYESEMAGEVDIEAFIDGRSFTRVGFPLFFMVFEDLSLDATPDQFVSSFGDVTADVRGYFVGSNPSGRPAEIKADGRAVPADRWILPNDWDRLKGESDLRRSWGSVDMPAAIITFLMENEGKVNNYKAKVKDGAAGFFIPDSTDDFSFNVNPHTNVTAILGTVSRPRMMSARSDGQGEASVDTFGDRNLSYEACAANAITGNPHCKPEQIVGKTRYFAVAEYPVAGNRGKFPAVASNVDETIWRWAGFKEVTVLNTDSPQIKYVVAHLRDRDGFCDAANYNNTLGVPVTFEIDAGDGVIIEAADRPFSINGTRRFATATTFDTTNALGEPINTHIAKPPLDDGDPDECQAWIKVTNSLLTITNVTVTFPAPPSPIPGDIRITNLQCTGQESITVKNFGTSEVNLGGFSILSTGDDVGNAEELDLIGILQPGESKSFLGGPEAEARGWIGVDNEVFEGATDYAALSWEGYALSTVFCNGERVDNSPLATLPLDGEGVIKLDIVVPFGSEIQVPLSAGWNLVATGAGTVSIDSAFAEFRNSLEAIYIWDAEKEKWNHYIPTAPASANTITEVGNGAYMWVLVKQPFTLTLPK